MPVKEVRELFAFLDTDRDGLLDVGQGINLCRQLGFNVDASTLQHAETHVSVKDLLGWCEVFVAKCAHSEDLHLTQMYQLLSQRHIGGGDGITSRGLRRFLADEKLSFPPEQAPSPTHLKALVCTLLAHARTVPRLVLSGDFVPEKATRVPLRESRLNCITRLLRSKRCA